VAYKVTDTFIYIMDPQIAGFRKIPKQKFLDFWWDLDTPKNYRVDRWYLYMQFKT